MLMMTPKNGLVDHALALAAQQWGGTVEGRTLRPIGEALDGLMATDHAEGLPRRWYVVQSEPQQESAATGGLIGRGLGAYLPVIPREVSHGRGKMRTVWRPLFPGYILCRLNLMRDHWQRIFSTAGVRGMLMAGDHPAIVPDDEVDRVKAIEESERAQAEAIKARRESAAAGRHDFTVGEVVRIVDGPFRGFNSEIVALDDGQRIAILLSVFGRPTRTVVTAPQIQAL